MARKNDITPPSNVKDDDLYEEQVLQGVSLQKAECAGESLGKILRFFLSKYVSRIDLLLGDQGWIFTYAMYELEDPSVLQLQKTDVDEQVIELLDCNYLTDTYGERAKQIGDDWEIANAKLYQGNSKIHLIKIKEVKTKYPETFERVKSFLTAIYLSKSKDEWVRRFKQAIGKNANEYVNRNQRSIVNEMLALQLSKAHSLYEAIIITTLAIELKSKFFAYPDTDLAFIVPIKKLLQANSESEKLQGLIKHLEENHGEYKNVEFKDVNILNPFCYKLPSVHSLTLSPKKKQAAANYSVADSKSKDKKSARQLTFFSEDMKVNTSLPHSFDEKQTDGSDSLPIELEEKLLLSPNTAVQQLKVLMASISQYGRMAASNRHTAYDTQNLAKLAEENAIHSYDPDKTETSELENNSQPSP